METKREKKLRFDEMLLPFHTDRMQKHVIFRRIVLFLNV